MILQTSSSGLVLSLDGEEATLLHADQPLKTWPVTRIASLTSRHADEVAGATGLLWIDRAAPQALAILRRAGQSFATARGELHIVEPPIVVVVEQPPARSARLAPSPARTLGKGAARIGRWLLLHPQDIADTTIGRLADECRCSDATASRAVAQLSERGFLRVTTAVDARRRTVNVTDASGLLEAIADEGPWRRARQTTWDIGASSTAHAFELLRDAAMRVELPHAVGGIAGAATIEPIVEPAVVTVWLPADDIDDWHRELLAEPARPAPGRLTVRVAPDPVVLDWGTEREYLCIADLVQLYIDCRHAGERAIDLADAMWRRIIPT